jgi:hypothetical protein
LVIGDLLGVGAFEICGFVVFGNDLIGGFVHKVLDDKSLNDP